MAPLNSLGGSPDFFNHPPGRSARWRGRWGWSTRWGWPHGWWQWGKRVNGPLSLVGWDITHRKRAWNPKIKWVIFRFHVHFSGWTLGYKTSRRMTRITRIIISIALVRDPFSDLYFPHFTTRGSIPKYIDNWKHNDSCPFLGGTTRRFFCKN